MTKSDRLCHYAMKRPCWQVKLCAIRDVFSDAISESWQETAIPDDRERQKKVEADAATQQVCTTATKLVSIFRLVFFHSATRDRRCIEREHANRVLFWTSFLSGWLLEIMDV